MFKAEFATLVSWHFLYHSTKFIQVTMASFQLRQLFFCFMTPILPWRNIDHGGTLHTHSPQPGSWATPCCPQTPPSGRLLLLRPLHRVHPDWPRPLAGAESDDGATGSEMWWRSQSDKEAGRREEAVLPEVEVLPTVSNFYKTGGRSIFIAFF